MTKVKFENKGQGNYRVKLSPLTTTAKVTIPSAHADDFTVESSGRVGFCLGPYVAPPTPVTPTLDIIDVTKFEGFIGDLLVIPLSSNLTKLSATQQVKAKITSNGVALTDQMVQVTNTAFNMPAFELVKEMLATTLTIVFELIDNGKVVATTRSKEITIATGRARITYTMPSKIVEGQEKEVSIVGRINRGKRGVPVKFTLTDSSDPNSTIRLEHDAVVDGAGNFAFKLDLSRFLDGGILVATKGTGADSAEIIGPYQTVDNYFPLMLKVKGGNRNLMVYTVNGTLNVPSRLTWGDGKAGPLANGHMVHTYATATTAVHDVAIRRGTGPLIWVKISECTIGANAIYTPVAGDAILEITNFGKAVLGMRVNASSAFTSVPVVLPAHVTNLDELALNCSNFNDTKLTGWDVSNVTSANKMLAGTAFNQNLSKWCVSKLTTAPTDFSLGAPLTTANKPVWGTCPVK